MRSKQGGGALRDALQSTVVIVIATFLILSMVAPVISLGAAASSTMNTSTTDEWRLEISTRNDPYRTGANNTTRWVNGTVSLIDSEAVDIVYVTLNGNENESFKVPVQKPGTVADGEFNFTITLDKRVNNITVTGYPNNDTVISDTLLLDGDVLPDTYEQETLSTDPRDPDSDSTGTAQDESDDGTIDAAEDFDGDELRAVEERRLGTDPLSVDTDDDSLRDGIESRYPGISPTALDGNNDGVFDRLGDIDGDGVDNLAEQNADTFLHLADTDNDGIPDSEEIDGPTDPTVFDTDGDGISDGVEQTIGTDPTSADSDGDGIVDVNETLTTVAENATLGTTVEVTGTGPVASVTTVRNATRERFNTSVVRASRVGPVRRVEAGVNFSGATVTVDYDESAVPNSNESDLVLYRQNETLNTFVPLDTDVDTSADQLSATIHQDSTVVAMAQSVWQERFPEQPPEFGREITFEDYNESDCRPGCEVENGTVTYGNSSKTSNSSSVDEDGPRIDDKDGGTETTTEQDVMGGFQEPESRSLPASTGDPFEAELQKPEHDYAEEPITLTVVHNRNESDIASYEWYYYDDLRVEEYDGKVHTDSFGYNDSYNLSVLVTTTSGESDWANLSKPATTRGKTPNIRIKGPTEATIDNSTFYRAPRERYGSGTSSFEWLVDGQDVQNDACTSGCVSSRHFEYDFQTEGYHTITHIQDFNNGDSVTKKIEVYVESTDRGIDSGKPNVNFQNPPTSASVGDEVSYTVDASDDGEIVSYNWSVKRPDGRWFNGIGDNRTTYGGKVTRPGEYVVQVAVTDNQNQTTTKRVTLTADSDSQSVTDPPTVELRGPSYAAEGDNVSYRAEASDEDGIQSYDWRIQRPNGYWFNPTNDNSDTYGGVIDSGVYTIEVTVTDDAGESTTVQKRVLSFSAETGLLTKHTREVTGDSIAVESGTASTVVEARVRAKASEGYAKLVAVGDSGTKEVFAVSATGSGSKDWRTVSVELTGFEGEDVTLRSEWTTGAEITVDDVRVTRDWDGDGLSNNREETGLVSGLGERIHTNQHLKDTDGDGLDDQTESGDFYTIYSQPRYTISTNPTAFDTDGDDLSDKEESNEWASNAKTPDTDEDGFIDRVDPAELKSDNLNKLEIQSDNWNSYAHVYVTDRGTPPGMQNFSGIGYSQGIQYVAVRNDSSVRVTDGFATDKYYVDVKKNDKVRYGNGEERYPDEYYINVTGDRGRKNGVLISPRKESANMQWKELVYGFGVNVISSGVGKAYSIGAAAYGSKMVAVVDGAALVSDTGWSQWGAKHLAEALTIEADGSTTTEASPSISGVPESPTLLIIEESSTPDGIGTVALTEGFKQEPLLTGVDERGFGWSVIKDNTGINEKSDIRSVLKSPTFVRSTSSVSYVIGVDGDTGDRVAIQLKNQIVISAKQVHQAYDKAPTVDEKIVMTTEAKNRIQDSDNNIDTGDVSNVGDIVQDSASVESRNVFTKVTDKNRIWVWVGSINGDTWIVRGEKDSETGTISIRKAERVSTVSVSDISKTLNNSGYVNL